MEGSMKKTAIALVALTALGGLAGCQDGEVKAAGASPTTTTTEPAVAPSGALGRFEPVSDVAQHARMSLDLCEVNALLDADPVDYAAVATLYRNGKNSDESEGTKRTLGTFAAEGRAAEDTLGRYERYLGARWLDTLVGDAVSGTGPFAGASDAVRRQVLRIAARDQIMVAWALHELDAAVDKAVKGSFTKKSGAPHNWDEAWAYWHGEKPECSPFGTVDALGKEFGVGGAVNRGIFVSMHQGLKALLAKSSLGPRTARDEVKRQVIIGYAQAMIKAASGLDAALAQGRTDEGRVRQAEGWAYYRVIEPLIAEVNITAAEALADVFDLSGKPAPGTKAKVGAALGSVYGPLRITPEDIGGDATAESGTAAPEAEAGEDDGGEEGPEDEAGAD
jgi:hypothetical protein